MAVSNALRFQIFRRDGHTCRYCGATAPDVKLHVDHVIPETLGGSDDPSNLKTACRQCNGGKGATPADASLVAEVSKDAERWASAMQQVANQRAQETRDRTALMDWFYKEWNSWTSRSSNATYDADGANTSIPLFIEAGLSKEDIADLIEVAMNSRAVDKWRYFCGCCWRRIKEDQERARQLLNEGAAAPRSPLRIATRWTEDNLKSHLSMDDLEVKYAGGLFDCEMHLEGPCENDTLCQIVAAARTRESMEAYAISKWRRERDAERINDAADEAEEYVHG